MTAPTIINFANNSQKNQVEAAFNEVRLLLGKADAAMIKLNQSPNATDQAVERVRFETWFGNYNAAAPVPPPAGPPWRTPQQLQQALHSMLVQLRDRPVTIDCRGANCQQGTYAYVAAAGGGLVAGAVINLCGVFYTTSLYGKDSQVGTLLHEVSHLVVATADHQYGQPDCKTLAANNIQQARNNADTFEFYIESFK